MSWPAAIVLLLRSPYVLCRRHPWRRPQIDRTGLWPQITIGWLTWDPIGAEMGKRLTEVADTFRAMGSAS
jgi:hypothetical protein